ncbi:MULTISPECIES: DUF2848 domain-containing protein [unclassified Rhodococcus (in: high G+C Gram-positive bacteria)]|uniref:DUF2848 domain-containing protein n=1 Tax=unclassified Rhodococcus (in: high G+C Gram-positive bacteria) TaxID=192944 RepID=UPI000B9A95CA|nr:MULTISPECIES: DUF2848 domain-containing protein [unclassified Rhodococcus (in: high G+C Gram-positive bacteria)]OZE37154.1 hypothetical protein CH259_09475 [Rhodococcus sp. 05-2254-4]OZE44786.1 hypothetical protein CH261_14420 [Rhodococcus sp. 05-2254-3]OZE45280.1 hypothetical protein CH283_23105 [Rhodococcus sp. 05-2254-2]
MLTFTLPDGSTESLEVTALLNAGYAGRNQDEVASHIAELAELGVPAPTVTPALYPISPYLAQQTDSVAVQHGRTSGEAEWALVILGDTINDVLLTVACDHTDRDLEVHSVAWSKNAAPDVLGTGAWRLSEVADRLDEITLTAWADGTLIQTGTLGDLLAPQYWLDVLTERGLFSRGTVLISGTISMHHGVNQFSDAWKVEMTDPATGNTLTCEYKTILMPAPIG